MYNYNWILLSRGRIIVKQLDQSFIFLRIATLII